MEQIVKEIQFYSGPFQMSGQIDFPNNKAKFYPLVFIVPAKPPHDRYGNVRGYPGYANYFQPVVKQLLDLGYAVFRYDKGGTGNSSSGLSANADFVSAYRTVCKQQNIDLNKISLLAFGGGSAVLFRTWMELTQINEVHDICFVSTGLNDLKLEDFSIPISLIANSDNFLRSKLALERYQERTKMKVGVYEIINASEQLCDQTKPVSLFKENGCIWHKEALKAIQDWYSSLK